MRKVTVSEQYFRDRVDVNEGGCWVWRLRTDKWGRAIMVIGTKQVAAQKVVWRVFKHEEVPNGMVFGHACGLKACINPEHLFLKKATGYVAQTLKRFGPRAPKPVVPPTPSVLTRDYFESNCTKEDTGCWLWKGRARGKEFKIPMTTYLGKSVSARRLAYAFFHGPVPEDHVVKPSCQNSLCLNPLHMIVAKAPVYLKLQEFALSESLNGNWT